MRHHINQKDRANIHMSLRLIQIKPGGGYYFEPAYSKSIYPRGEEGEGGRYKWLTFVTKKIQDDKPQSMI